jgi:ribosomal protein S27E
MTRMFCSKEGTKTEIKSARTVVFKGGHKAFKGTCRSCGRILTRPMW